MEKLTAKQLKEKLQGCDQSELIDVITHLYKIEPAATEFINIRFGNSQYLDELLEEKKNTIEKLLFGKHLMYSYTLSELKKVVSDVQKVCSEPKALIDFQLFYVQRGTKFVYDCGGSPEAFINHLVSTFQKAIKELIKMHSEEDYKTFEPRIKEIIEIAGRADYAFDDEFLSIMDSVKWYKAD